MGLPPKAMKYITCRVMSFRPWQASCGPLRGLSRLHSGISLSSSLFPLCLLCLFFSSAPLLHAILLYSLSSLSSHSLFPSFSSHHSSYSPRFHPNLLPLSLFTSSASWCMPVICDQPATERRNTLQCHDPETPH